MMMLPTFTTVLAGLSLVAALPTYQIPKMLLQADDCAYPEGYEVDQLQAWFPAAGNNHSATLNFAYWDNSTQLQAICHLNSTSVNVARPGLAARYACSDANVNFIWQNNTLRMIERACPDTASATKFEASGSVKPTLNCVETLANSTHGVGMDCYASDPFLTANFTSLQPSPRRV